MKYLSNDLAVLQVVDKFTMLRTDQIASLVFPQAKSATSTNRVLQRLVKARLLEILPLSVHAPRVYQLSARGWQELNKSGRYKHRLVVDSHALAVADTYIRLFNTGDCELVEALCEPDCWVNIAGLELRPDMSIEALLLREKKTFKAFIEVDLGGERGGVMKEKFERYSYAFSKRDKTVIFPVVLFICQSEKRVATLKQSIKAGGYREKLFQVMTLDDLPAYIAGL